VVLRGWPIAGLYEEFERLRSGTFGALHERVEARPRELRIGRVRVKPLGRVGTAAAAAGRDPAEIRRIYNLFGSIRKRGTDGFLQGPVEQWADELTELVVEHGIDSFVFGPAEDPVRQVQVFAAEVAPAVREAVARHRHTPEPA
jgi:hypothetical protein